MLLNGVRVVELAQIIAGPMAGQILAELGADVIKVERPEGDDARNWVPPTWHDSSPMFHSMNRGKRSVRLDLTTEDGRRALKRLVADADIFIQNLRPGVLAKLGLGPDVLTEVNPRLIYCEMGAFGHRGPKRLAPGFEPLLQAYTGLMDHTGEPDRDPVRLGAPVCDITTGMWTVIGAVSALQRRAHTGKGAVINTSLLESGLALMSPYFASMQASGEPPRRHPTGSPRVVVFQTFHTADGRIMITAATDRLFAKLCDGIGRPEWAQDPRFKGNAGRIAHKDEILNGIQAVLEQDTTAVWLERLEPLGAPCAPINNLVQAVADPQVEAMDIVRQAADIDARFIGLPLSIDGVRPPLGTRAPDLGGHDQLLERENPWT